MKGEVSHFVDMTETFGFGIETESLAGFGLKSEAKSLNGFGLSYD